MPLASRCQGTFATGQAPDKFSAMTIDTLDYVNKLEAAGVDRHAAEAASGSFARGH